MKNTLYTLSETIELHKKQIVTTVCLIVAVICLLVIFISVKAPSYPEELVRIDTICNNNPHKAEQMLNVFLSADKARDKETGWYARYIRLKADVKQAKDITDEKEVTAILKHYQSLGDTRMLKSVYYYVGCAYNSLGRVPLAVDCFQKGLSLWVTCKNVWIKHKSLLV